MSGTSSRSGERPKYRLNFATAWMEDRCIAGDRLQTVMFSIMRRPPRGILRRLRLARRRALERDDSRFEHIRRERSSLRIQLRRR